MEPAEKQAVDFFSFAASFTDRKKTQIVVGKLWQSDYRTMGPFKFSGRGK